jgi:phosphinothricin acetyltransferase
MHRHGVGARFVSHLLNRARDCGLHVLVASIDAGNLPSVALFERFGFVERARLPEVGRKFGEWRTQVLLHRGLESSTA